MSGRTYARRMQSETGDRGWWHQVARTSSMRLRRVIWLGCPGCARSPRRGPCGYEGELSVKRVSERCDGSQVRAASSQGGAGRWRGFAAVTVGARALPGAAKGVAVLGAWDRVSRGAAPPLTPARPSSCCRRFAAVCPLFCCVSGGYALPLGVAPCFLIVYAPAMRAVAYYALGWGCSCARLAVRRCRAWACCGAWGFRACGRVVRPVSR